MKTYLFALVFIATPLMAQDSVLQNSVLLDGQLAKALLMQCSRDAPTHTETWQPSDTTIKELEENLPDITRLKSNVCCGEGNIEGDPKAYYRQYVSIIINETPVIYINASKMPWHDKNAPNIVCDGGKDFWGALYHPGTKQFFGLAFNGEA